MHEHYLDPKLTCLSIRRALHCLIKMSKQVKEAKPTNLEMRNEMEMEDDQDG